MCLIVSCLFMWIKNISPFLAISIALVCHLCLLRFCRERASQRERKAGRSLLCCVGPGVGPGPALKTVRWARRLGATPEQAEGGWRRLSAGEAVIQTLLMLLTLWHFFLLVLD